MTNEEKSTRIFINEPINKDIKFDLLIPCILPSCSQIIRLRGVIFSREFIEDQVPVLFVKMFPDNKTCVLKVFGEVVSNVLSPNDFDSLDNCPECNSPFSFEKVKPLIAKAKTEECYDN